MVLGGYIWAKNSPQILRLGLDGYSRICLHYIAPTYICKEEKSGSWYILQINVPPNRCGRGGLRVTSNNFIMAHQVVSVKSDF